MDPSVRPPIITNKDHPNRSMGRIVVNVRSDGSVTGVDLQVLESDEAIAEYISTSRDKIVAEGLIPKLHLRGDQKSVFEHSRKVIKIAAEQNVTQVVFAVYENVTSPASGEKGEKPIHLDKHVAPPRSGLADSIADFIAPKPGEQDLGMALPTPVKPEEIGDSVFIDINAQGQILYGKDKQLLDQDASVRDLPLLASELEKAKQRADEKKVLVTMHADPAVAQQRVIDVLNALAQCGISSVTFTDLIE